MAEAVEVLRRLLDGEEVTDEGDHYRLRGVRTMPSRQPHLPILVGVNGTAALAHAARHADVIGLTMLGRTLEDGQRHAVRWEPARFDATSRTFGHAAADRAGRWSSTRSVQLVRITDDRRAAAEELAAGVPGLSVDDALATPFLVLGTPTRSPSTSWPAAGWGISYLTVRSIDEFAPVIARLRAPTELTRIEGPDRRRRCRGPRRGRARAGDRVRSRHTGPPVTWRRRRG